MPESSAHRQVSLDDVASSQLPRRGGRATRWLARRILRLVGWRTVGTLPDVPRLVMIAVPHTTNWDFPLGILTMYSAGFRVNFLGKDTLFRPPLGWVVRWLGGRPVNRSAAHGVVEESVRTIRASDRFILALAPEGTRKRVTNWRTGFFGSPSGAACRSCWDTSITRSGKSVSGRPSGPAAIWTATWPRSRP